MEKQEVEEMKKTYEDLKISVVMLADDVITDSVEVSFEWDFEG